MPQSGKGKEKASESDVKEEEPSTGVHGYPLLFLKDVISRSTT